MNVNISKNVLLHKATLAITAGLIFAGIQMATTGTASAAYDSDRIIDNTLFLDAKSMSAQQIQSFLNDRGGQLASRSFILDCDAAGQQAKSMYISVGAPCGQNSSSANIIYYASQVYGVSPKVILATLQKEQSLITATNPTDRQYAQAMGYACPTSGDCNSSSNFFWQIDNGTWVLRYHYERANGNFSWWNPSSTWTCGTEKNLYKPNLYPRQNVDFYDTNGTKYATVYIQNAATSAFYCYTPHVYNNPQGLYGRAPYGTTGLYYSGSYNFVSAYNLWFGSTQIANCRYPGPTTDTVYRLYNKASGGSLLTTNPDEVCIATSNGWLYDDKFATQGSSRGAEVYRLRHGSVYLLTSSVAERDNAISRFGYVLEGRAFYSPLSSDQGSLPVYRLQDKSGGYLYTISNAERDKLTSEGNIYDGVAFYLKELPGISIVQTYRLAHPNGSYLFTQYAGERDVAVTGYGYRYEGIGFNVVTQLNSITIPIYRLAGSGGYLFTTSLSERLGAIKLGYRDEGVGMYTYGTVSDPSLKNIYRLARSGSYFYTTSYQEALVGRNVHSFRLEGIGFQTP